MIAGKVQNLFSIASQIGSRVGRRKDELRMAVRFWLEPFTEEGKNFRRNRLQYVFLY